LQQSVIVVGRLNLEARLLLLIQRLLGLLDPLRLLIIKGLGLLRLLGAELLVWQLLRSVWHLLELWLRLAGAWSQVGRALLHTRTLAYGETDLLMSVGRSEGLSRRIDGLVLACIRILV